MCTIAVTGPRPHKFGHDFSYKKPQTLKIRSEMERVIRENNCTELITGMAQGVDTIAAMIAVAFQIPFTAAVPFYKQEMLWRNQSKATYYELLYKATHLVYVHDDPGFRPDKAQPGYLNTLYQNRNEWMVNKLVNPGDLLLSVWDGSSGGTKNCVVYAGNKEPRIRNINIHPATLQIIQVNNNYESPQPFQNKATPSLW